MPQKTGRTHSNASPHSTHHAKVSTLKGLRRNQTHCCEPFFFLSLQVCTAKNPLFLLFLFSLYISSLVYISNTDDGEF